MDTREHLLAIESEMQQRYIDRADVIHGLVLGAISGHHVLIVSPPGAAKTMMVKDFADYLGARHFHRLLTAFSSPDELFGPVDIAALKQGVYRRIVTHKLPEAEVAYIDEIFKANSAILNSMLGVLQERVYENDGSNVTVPLLFCVASSNEIPDDSEGLHALYDRFLLRYQVGYLSGSAFVDMLRLQPMPKLVGTLPIADVQQARTESRKLPVADEVYESLSLLQGELTEHGIVSSPRRYKYLLDVMAAEAWLSGASHVTVDELPVAAHLLWHKPEQASEVSVLVQKAAGADAYQAQEIVLAAKEVVDVIRAQAAITQPAEIINTVQELRAMVVKLQSLRVNRKVVEALRQVQAYQTLLTEWALGSKPVGQG